MKLVASVALLALAGCGGGGTAPQDSTNGSQTLDLSLGTPASVQIPSATDSVYAHIMSQSMTVQLVSGNGTAYNPFDRLLNYDNTRAMSQSEIDLLGIWITPEVKAAWAQGWTGAGVKTGVIDDFTPNDTSEFFKISFPTGCTNTTMPGGNVTLCRRESFSTFRLTHGDAVAAIIGSATSSFTGSASEKGIFSTSTDFGSFTGLADLNVTFSTPYYGIARDAQVVRSDFLSYQQSTSGLFSVLQGWAAGSDYRSQLYNERKVINFSMSASSTDAAVNKRIYDSQMAYATTSITPDIVFVKAAGNYSCVASTDTCDPINSVFYNAVPYKDKTILVGALDQSGGQLASYSNTAGAYADRFVVADGRGARVINGTYQVGTSFASPRVAGYVAIIRHKFPRLSAAQAAKVLLDTAVWNPAWGEKTAATQAIYGQGEANLTRALDPALFSH